MGAVPIIPWFLAKK